MLTLSNRRWMDPITENPRVGAVEVWEIMNLANDFLRGRQAFTHHRIIARPHEVLTQQLDRTTSYTDAKLHELEGEEAS